MTKRFLDNGSPVKTISPIYKNNIHIKFQNPEKLLTGMIPINTLGRIHSSNNGVYTVWLNDESTYNTIIIEVPLAMMGSSFVQHQHGMFPHFR